MLETISAYELREWEILEGIEPLGEQRLDLLMGMVSALMANIHRGNRQPYMPSEFMPNFNLMPREPDAALPAGPAGRDQTPDEIFAALDRFERNYKAIQAAKRKPVN